MQLSRSKKAKLAAVCKRWPIAKLQLFGSRVRGEAKRNSDYDLLVYFDPAHRPSLFELGGIYNDFRDALEAPVDVIEHHHGVPRSIVNNAQTIFQRR